MKLEKTNFWNSGFHGLRRTGSALAKHFAAWLKLAPNNKISGGRVLSNRIPPGGNRQKIALRNSANAVGNLKESDLAKFFRRIAFKKGRQTAINATARKIAVIIWNIVTKKEPYQPRENYLFVHQKRQLLKKMKKQLKDMGLRSWVGLIV